MSETELKLAVAMKWLDKIASFGQGDRQRSGTETEDFYLKGVYDADVATRKLVDMAKEEIARTVISDDEWLNMRYQVYVPGEGILFHIADDLGSTLCGAPMADVNPNEICDKCEEIKERLTKV